MSHLDREQGVFIETFRGPMVEQELALAGVHAGCRLRSRGLGVVAEFVRAYRVNGRTWLDGRVIDSHGSGFAVGHIFALRINDWEALDAPH